MDAITAGAPTPKSIGRCADTYREVRVHRLAIAKEAFVPYVSPYLLLAPRSLTQVLAERTAREASTRKRATK